MRYCFCTKVVLILIKCHLYRSQYKYSQGLQWNTFSILLQLNCENKQRFVRQLTAVSGYLDSSYSDDMSGKVISMWWNPVKGKLYYLMLYAMTKMFEVILNIQCHYNENKVAK